MGNVSRLPDLMASKDKMITRASRSSWLMIFVTGVVAPTIVLLSIWWPVIEKYWVTNDAVLKAQIEQLKFEPSDDVLVEIGRQSLAVGVPVDNPLLLRRVADGILEGKLDLPGYQPIALSNPFHIDDLERVADTLGLHLGSLVEVRVLLDAYKQELREEYLAVAVRRFVGFAEAERKAWLPHGFLWNDHAIASRISLSAELWRLARKHPRYGAELEAALPLHILRSTRMLAKPAQYTYATNHGVMQNVALMQAAAAFPGISEMHELAELALKRLDAQLGHYLSPEGMILEHSAGYHKHGVELLTIAVRAAELANLQVPPEWRNRIAQARYVLEVIRRPDGSMPRFGNTFGAPAEVHDFIPLTVQMPQDGLLVLPVSGFVFWRTSRQLPCNNDAGIHVTLVASLFPGNGHKLADEGSLMFWAGGRTWFDNTGYWPYGQTGRTDVDGWRGSNAPHLSQEPAGLPRVPLITHAVDGEGMTFLAFSRTNQNGSRLRREILGVDGTAWLVFDSVETPVKESLETLWTFEPELQVVSKNGSIRGYELVDPGNGCLMDMLLAPGDSVKTMKYRGDLSPFGGWMVREQKPVPADAIQLSSDMGQMAVLYVLRGKEQPSAALINWHIDKADHWQARIKLPSESGELLIERTGKAITLASEAGNNRQLHLATLPSPLSERAKITSSLQQLAALNPVQRDYIPWRIKITKAVLATTAAILSFMTLVAWRYARWLRLSGMAFLAAWAALALWLRVVYFA